MDDDHSVVTLIGRYKAFVGEDFGSDDCVLEQRVYQDMVDSGCLQTSLCGVPVGGGR